MSEILRVCDNYVLNFASVIVGQFPNYWNDYRRTARLLLIQDVLAAAKEKEQNQLQRSFPGFREGFYLVKVRADFGITKIAIHQYSALIPKGIPKISVLVVSNLYFTLYLLGPPKGTTKKQAPHL